MVAACNSCSSHITLGTAVRPAPFPNASSRQNCIGVGGLTGLTGDKLKSRDEFLGVRMRRLRWRVGLVGLTRGDGVWCGDEYWYGLDRDLGRDFGGVIEAEVGG